MVLSLVGCSQKKEVVKMTPGTYTAVSTGFKGDIEVSVTVSEDKIENIEVARPMTHDLIINMVEDLGGEINRIEINDVADDTYYANIVITLRITTRVPWPSPIASPFLPD